MVIGQLSLRLDVFYFLCGTHATNGIEDAYTKAIPQIWRETCVQEENIFLLLFFAQNEAK